MELINVLFIGEPLDGQWFCIKHNSVENSFVYKIPKRKKYMYLEEEGGMPYLPIDYIEFIVFKENVLGKEIWMGISADIMSEHLNRNRKMLIAKYLLQRDVFNMLFK